MSVSLIEAKLEVHPDKVTPDRDINVGGVGTLSPQAFYQLFERTVQDRSLVPAPFRVDLSYVQKDHRSPFLGSSGDCRMESPFGVWIDIYRPFDPTEGNLNKMVGLLDQARFNAATLSANFTLAHEWYHLLETVRHFQEVIACETACNDSRCRGTVMLKPCIRFATRDEMACDSFARREVTQIVEGKTDPVLILS